MHVRCRLQAITERGVGKCLSCSGRGAVGAGDGQANCATSAASEQVGSSGVGRADGVRGTAASPADAAVSRAAITAQGQRVRGRRKTEAVPNLFPHVHPSVEGPVEDGGKPRAAQGPTNVRRLKIVGV